MFPPDFRRCDCCKEPVANTTECPACCRAMCGLCQVHKVCKICYFTTTEEEPHGASENKSERQDKAAAQGKARAFAGYGAAKGR